MTLEELLGVLGGAICTDGEHRWLESQVGGLRACIITSALPDMQDLVVEVAVVTPDSSVPPDEPVFFDVAPIAMSSYVQPRLSHGFVFLGRGSGVLFARSVGTPSLEGVVATLWALADWTRNPAPAISSFSDMLDDDERQRRSRRFKLLVLIAVMLWMLVSWLHSPSNVLLHPRIG